MSDVSVYMAYFAVIVRIVLHSSTWGRIEVNSKGSYKAAVFATWYL